MTFDIAQKDQLFLNNLEKFTSTLTQAYIKKKNDIRDPQLLQGIANFIQVYSEYMY